MSDDAYAIEQYASRDAWLAARRDGIGSSEAPAVLGQSPARERTPNTVYLAKVTGEVAAEESEAMLWGTILEAPVAEEYVRRTGRTLRNLGPYTRLRSRKYPWMTATLDRVIEDVGPTPVQFTLDGVAVPSELVHPPAVYEGKTTGYGYRAAWETGVPDAVLAQVQHQLAVTGLGWASVAVLIGGQRLLWVDVPRHEGFIALLIEAEAAFWERVLDRTPPTIDASEATRQILRHRYPREVPGTSVPLGDEGARWDTVRQEAVAQIAAWTAKLEEASNHLRALIGDHEAGVLPSGAYYTSRLIQRRGYPVASTEYRDLRRHTMRQLTP